MNWTRNVVRRERREGGGIDRWREGGRIDRWREENNREGVK